MKIIEDHTIPAPSEDEMDDIFHKARSVEDATPEEFEAMRREMAGVKRVVIPDHVMNQLKECGVSPDEIVAMLLKKMKMSQ